MINQKRVQRLTEKEYEKGAVIYQMCRDMRAHDNEALLFAAELAYEKKEKLIVNYVIYNYLWEGATARFYEWVIASLQEVEKTLREHNIPLVVTFEEEKLFNKTRKVGEMPKDIGAVVIDQIPLHFARKWKEIYLKHYADIPLYEVDAHNCIPVWETSPKQEFAARTIRSKVHAKLPDFLEEFDTLKKYTPNEDILDTVKEIDWEEVRKKIVCAESVKGTGVFTPGEKASHKVLQTFLEDKLEEYGESRNTIDIDGQSNLSPYISHGNISRRRIMLELLKKTKLDVRAAFDPVMNGSNGKLGSVAAFIEEAVVRAELCENYCYYNHTYDTYEGFPEWAKKTLDEHASDTREHIYSYEALRDGRTGDELWNAAQMQMVTTGKMHGYMRMYWAKKILEWSKSPQEAMKFAVKLNDIYELDGRDPNGYVGCAWSIGGVHDRPWFARPIFGTIRYMAESGVKKRGNIDAYIAKFLSPSKLI